VQVIAEVFDARVAEAFGLGLDDVVVTIPCGSRRAPGWPAAAPV
jgi:RNA-splicing ligase RtcB